MSAISPEVRRNYICEAEHIRVFFAKAPVLDIAEFCEKYGYCVEIQDQNNYYMRREYGI